MKKCYESLREYATKIINLKRRKLNLLTKQEQESHQNAQSFYIFKEIFENE